MNNVWPPKHLCYLQSSVRKDTGPRSGPLFLNAHSGRRAWKAWNAARSVSSFSWLTKIYPRGIPPASEQVTNLTSFVSYKSSEDVASTATISSACCNTLRALLWNGSTTQANISILWLRDHIYRLALHRHPFETNEWTGFLEIETAFIYCD